MGHPEWKPQRMVFVMDEGQKIWVVVNPKALKGLEGKHVPIKGQVNAGARTIRVIKATEMNEVS